MRVLFVSPYYEPAWIYGGPPRSVSAWARALTAVGCEVDVFTTTANGKSELQVPSSLPILRDGVRVTYFPRWRATGNRFFSASLGFACLQQATNYDVLYTTGLWTFPSAIGSWIAHQRHIPFIVSTHGTLMPWAYDHHALRKRLSMALFERNRLSHAACGICSSPLELKSVSKLRLFRRLELLPNIVKIPAGLADQECNCLRKQLNLEDSFVFLFAGRLVKNKGIDLTVAAFMQIWQNYPQAKLVIVGPDEDDTGRRLRLQVDRQGMSDKIFFTGMLEGEDYWDAIACADVFVFNSYSENFAMAVAEALAFGKPVLISDHVGIADFVNQYDAGIVTTLDVDQISVAMVFMLSHQDKLKEMGQRGMHMVQENFSYSAVGQRLAGILEDAVRQAS